MNDLERLIQEELDRIELSMKVHEAKASFLLTPARERDALSLAHVLNVPTDLSKTSKRVSSQAQRMWDRFGKSIDVSVKKGTDGYLHIIGGPQHVAALCDLYTHNYIS